MTGPPAWWKVLRKCGYPTSVVIVDFETYYDSEFSLTKLSTVEYIEDERYEELGCAIAEIDQPFTPFVCQFWRPGPYSIFDHLRGEYGDNLQRATVVAHNAQFDVTILARKYGINPPHVVDTKGLAAHDNARASLRLKDLATRNGLPPKGDTVDFKGLSFRPRWVRPKKEAPKLVPPMNAEQSNALSEYAVRDGLIEWEIFKIYLPRLSRPEAELRVMQHTLELYWKPTLEIDTEKAASIKVRMVDEVERVVGKTGRSHKQISGNITFARALDKALDHAGDDPTKYMKIGAKGMMFALAKDDPERELLQNHSDEGVRDLIEARIAIKSWPLHISRVDKIVAQSKAAGGKLCVPLNYHGAHTGRWSGGGGINLQNLGSRGHPLIAEIREMLVPPTGSSLVVVDASQVESRGTAWIAGEEGLLDQFRRGEDPYLVLASAMVGKTIRKPRNFDPATVAAYLKKMRNCGKVGILGGGYGMGAVRAREYARDFGLDLSLTESENLIRTYRRSVPAITRFWRDVEREFKMAAKYHQTGQLPRGLKFRWIEETDATVLTLPSGRELKYHKVRCSTADGRDTLWMPHPKHQGKKIHMWGGYLTENIVQAFCRDLLAESMLDLEREGFHTALTVHDELVLVSPDNQAKKCLEKSVQSMSTTPEWAEGLPLSAEGSIMKRYGK
ncbi:hypothetical protein LCGC14_1473970 [marine sediment metagenome]|uniref:DNA-directed DNA polymerase family A palm domain-containing protein n=1 Tax=marine sediment metagenome TaxID=412755 RepID=A0A0F9LS05_9ZZZZ